MTWGQGVVSITSLDNHIHPRMNTQVMSISYRGPEVEQGLSDCIVCVCVCVCVHVHAQYPNKYAFLGPPWLPKQGMQVCSLVGELRSHVPQPKNQNIKQKQHCNKFIKALKVVQMKKKILKKCFFFSFQRVVIQKAS